MIIAKRLVAEATLGPGLVGGGLRAAPGSPLLIGEWPEGGQAQRPAPTKVASEARQSF